MTRKLHAGVNFRVKESGSDTAEIIGVEFDKDVKLTGYLSLVKGRYPENNREIMVPSSLLESVDLDIGDVVKIEGRTASRTFNRASYKVSGIYRSPGLSLFSVPRLLLTYSAMENYYQPSENNVEYCLFFKNRLIPENINVLLREAAGDKNYNRIERIETRFVTIMNVIDLSVQFNVFLVVLIAITVLVMFTVVILVNFNFSLIVFRKRKPEYGTLLSFGIRPWKISLSMYLESLVELALCALTAVALAFTVSILGQRQLADGFLESLFVLLSGTNRIDFFIKDEHILNAVFIAFAGITIARIPIIFRIMRSNPIAVMRRDS